MGDDIQEIVREHLKEGERRIFTEAPENAWRETMANHEPWISAALSWYLPGFGHFYIGERRTGAALLFVSTLVVVLAVWEMIDSKGNALFGWVLLLVFYLLSLLAAIHSFVAAKRSNIVEFEKTRTIYKDPYLALILSWLIPGIGHLYLKEIVKAVFFLALFVAFLLYQDQVPWYVSDCYAAIVSYHILTTARFRDRGTTKTGKTLLSFLLGFAILIHGGRDYVKSNYLGTAHGYGPSMSPTIQETDIMLWDKRVEKPMMRGSIVAFEDNQSHNHELLIKRIVAFEGEVVELKEGKAFVNGTKLSAFPFDRIEYWTDSTCLYPKPGESYMVPPNSLFVLGDNSARSLDSRNFGSISKEAVRGTIYRIIWPIDRIANL